MMFAQSEGEDKKGKITESYFTLKLIVLSLLWQIDPNTGLISRQANKFCSG